jgi:hypothetical protein
MNFFYFYADTDASSYTKLTETPATAMKHRTALSTQSKPTATTRFDNTGGPLSEYKEADGVEVFSIIDNSVDFLSTVKKEHSSFRMTRKKYGSECCVLKKES